MCKDAQLGIVFAETMKVQQQTTEGKGILGAIS